MARDLTNIPPGQTDCSVCGFTKDNTEFSFYKERKTANGYRLMVNTNCRACQKLKRIELSKLKKFTKHHRMAHIAICVVNRCLEIGN